MNRGSGKEETASKKSKQGNDGVRPEQESEVERSSVASAVRDTEGIKCIIGDAQNQDTVGNHPKQNQTGTETLVRVIEGLLLLGLNRLVRCQRTLHGSLESRIDVGLWLVGFVDDLGFSAIASLGLGCGKNIGLVGSLGTPRNIVPIAEGIDVEDVGIRRGDEQVLWERVEQVPWIEVKEGGDDVETKGSSQGNQNDTTRTLEEVPEELSSAACIQLERLEGLHDEVDGQDDDIELDDGEEDERGDISVFRTLRSVTESQNELYHDKTEVYVLQDDVNDRSSRTERPRGLVWIGWSAGKTHDDESSKPEVCKTEPRENEGEDVVEELDVEEEHAERVVARLVETTEMNQRVDTSGERTVEPTTSLRDKLGSTVRNVSFGLRQLDVCQMPLLVLLGHQLETENTIFGQEHVLLEDIHTLDTLGTETRGERVVTVEVLLQRPAKDGTESVSREGTGKHRDVTERRFQRLVENVGNLVFEVLGGDQRVNQVLETSAQHGVDFTTGTAEVLVIVESFPEVQDGLWTRLGTSIQKNADFGVQDLAEGVEQPSVGVDFLGVLLLQAEHHLDRGKTLWVLFLWSDQHLRGGNRQLCRVLENMGNSFLVVDFPLHDTVLENTNCG